MWPPNHRCDEQCICPIHRTPLLFGRNPEEHACQDPDCRYAHGLERELDPARSRFCPECGSPYRGREVWEGWSGVTCTNDECNWEFCF